MKSISVFILPSVVVFSLALGGCSRDEAPKIPSGGAYLSTSAGASFDQAVRTKKDNQFIGGFDLGKIHRSLKDSNVVYMAAGNKGMVISSDDGATWDVIPTSMQTTVDVAMLKNGVFLAAGLDEAGQGVVMRSLDTGKSWQNVFTIPLPPKQPRFQIISGGSVFPTSIVALEVDPKATDTVWAGTNDGTIFSATSSGQVWKTVTELKSASQIVTGDRSDAGIMRMEVSPTQEGQLTIVTHKKQLVRVEGGKPTVIKVPAAVVDQSVFGVLEKDRNVLNFTLVSGFPNALLLGTEHGAVFTKDGGKTFSEIRLPIDASKVLTSMVVAVSPSNTNRMLIAADGIVYRSEDGGDSWNTTSVGPVGFGISDISINPKNASRVLAILKPVQN